MGINEIKVELSENCQRYVNECCESESDGKIDGFGAGCCKHRGGVAVAVWSSSTSDASPKHSLMHSCHTTSAAQDALDALMIQHPPHQLVTTSSSAKSIPPPAGRATQDTPLPAAPATAPVETKGWKNLEGKPMQRKKKNMEMDKKWAKEIHDKTPMTKNSGWGKNSCQLRPKNTSTKKTWADVIKSGGMNVQIVLGNGNLGLTILTTKRGER
jgi:hypothetical protein